MPMKRETCKNEDGTQWGNLGKMYLGWKSRKTRQHMNQLWRNQQNTYTDTGKHDCNMESMHHVWNLGSTNTNTRQQTHERHEWGIGEQYYQTKMQVTSLRPQEKNFVFCASSTTHRYILFLLSQSIHSLLLSLNHVFPPLGCQNYIFQCCFCRSSSLVCTGSGIMPPSPPSTKHKVASTPTCLQHGSLMQKSQLAMFLLNFGSSHWYDEQPLLYVIHTQSLSGYSWGLGANGLANLLKMANIDPLMTASVLTKL